MFVFVVSGCVCYLCLLIVSLLGFGSGWLLVWDCGVAGDCVCCDFVVLMCLRELWGYAVVGRRAMV